MAVCMGANPQGLEYGLHYRRAGNRPLDDGKYCLILQKQRPEHFAPAAVFNWNNGTCFARRIENKLA